MPYCEETITLKRIDKKLWQYESCSPKRVELAALDYLKSTGWRGYFSEHFDFDHTLTVMMSFCNSSWYVEGKADARDFAMPNGVTPDLPIRTIDDAFLFATDGYWNFDNHHFSSADLYENAQSFMEVDICRLLRIWKERGVEAFFVGRAYHSPRPATELNSDDLLSYFRARGGSTYFIDLLRSRFPASRQKLLSRSRLLSERLVESENFDLEDKVRDLVRDAGYYLGVFRSAKKMPEVEVWAEKIELWNYTPLSEEAVVLSADIVNYLAQTRCNPAGYNVDAMLDLVIWKDRVANVEVKAPNDKLRPHQVSQLLKDKEAGRLSWVINVIEA